MYAQRLCHFPGTSHDTQHRLLGHSLRGRIAPQDAFDNVHIIFLSKLIEEELNNHVISPELHLQQKIFGIVSKGWVEYDLLHESTVLTNMHLSSHGQHYTELRWPSHQTYSMTIVTLRKFQSHCRILF